MSDKMQILHERIVDLAAEVARLRTEQGALDPRKRWLNYQEAAILLDTTPGSLAADVSRRRVPFVKRGRRTLFDRFALEAHLAKYAVPAGR